MASVCLSQLLSCFHASSSVCSVICSWTVIFSVIPGSHPAKCYSILSHFFLLHMKLFLRRLKTKKKKKKLYCSSHCHHLHPSSDVYMCNQPTRQRYSSTSSVEHRVWFRNPLVNASVKINYNLSLHVALSPVCDLIIGSDNGPGHISIYNSNILSQSQCISMELQKIKSAQSFSTVQLW